MDSGPTKFWGGAGSGASDSEDADSSSSSSEDEGIKTTQKRAVPTPGRWAAMDDSSSEDEERRVVKSAKDKRWDALRLTLKLMANHKRIEDFGEILAGFDSLLKGISKSKLIVEKEGIPKFLIRGFAELETFINTKFADKGSLKKYSKAKATAFNTLRAKVRKGLEEYREQIDESREHPSRFESEGDDEAEGGDDDGMDSSASSSSSSDEESDDESSPSDDDDDDSSSDSGSDSDGSSKSGSGSSSSSDSDSSSDEEGSQKSGKSADEWGSSEAESEVEMDLEDRHQRGLQKWGKKTETDKKKKSATKDKAKAKAPKVVKKSVTEKAGPTKKEKAALIIFPGEKIDAELLNKKLAEVTALRGRKGFDRGEQIRALHKLVEAAAAVSPQSELDVLGHLISAYFDANLGAFACMPSAQWVQCFEQISHALTNLRGAKERVFPFVMVEEEEDEGLNAEIDPDAITTSTTSMLKKAAGGAGTGVVEAPMTKEMKEEKAQLSTALILTNFLERLDDELTKALQLTDLHSQEYKTRLGQTVDMLALLWRAHQHFLKSNRMECARNVALRILEQIYYKPDKLAVRMWELVKKRLPKEEAVGLPNTTSATSELVETLVTSNFSDSTDAKVKTRALLYLAYSKSLHGQFHDARDYLQTSNVQELASQCGISTQILYNRNLVQLGLAAFRLGNVPEAHAYLSEVCAMNRYKELLAQGLSNFRGTEKTPEQERAEKRRLLPYHMHVSADLIEGVHNICAMLLEVPYMAAHPFDFSKKPIARNFRRMLEMYDRQIFTGPPENPRETIMAATKALQKGDWAECVAHVGSLKFWESMPDSESVRAILVENIKQEALRTYLFSYSSLYDAFSVTQLAVMFSLEPSMVHSIVSKMMINGELLGSWDETSECILINHVQRTGLQVMALKLLDKVVQSMDQNETLINYRNPKYVGGLDRRYRNYNEQRGYNNERR